MPVLQRDPVPISELPVAIGLTGAEYFPLTQGGVTKRAGVGLLFNGADASVQDANTVLAGPTSGADAAPTFRALVSADFPFGTPTATDAWLCLKAGTTALASINLLAGTLKTTPAAGDVEFDGAAHYKTIDTSSGRGQVPVEQFFHLTADGSAITTIANFFGASSNIALVANAYYIIEIFMFFLNTTSGTVTWTLTNSAAPTSQNIWYEQAPVTGVHSPPGQADQLVGYAVKDTTAARTYTTGTLDSAVDHYVRIKLFLANGSGTSLKIQATKNVGGSITPRRESFWIARRVPAGNVGTFAA